MKKMSEVFELPLVTDDAGDIANGSGDWVLYNPSASEIYGAHVAHAVNHVDELERALEWMIEIAENVDTGSYDYGSAKAALTAYRGEK
jgi:hypothetical protein